MFASHYSGKQKPSGQGLSSSDGKLHYPHYRSKYSGNVAAGRDLTHFSMDGKMDCLYNRGPRSPRLSSPCRRAENIADPSKTYVIKDDGQEDLDMLHSMRPKRNYMDSNMSALKQLLHMEYGKKTGDGIGADTRRNMLSSDGRREFADNEDDIAVHYLPPNRPSSMCRMGTADVLQFYDISGQDRPSSRASSTNQTSANNNSNAPVSGQILDTASPASLCWAGRNNSSRQDARYTPQPQENESSRQQSHRYCDRLTVHDARVGSPLNRQNYGGEATHNTDQREGSPGAFGRQNYARQASPGDRQNYARLGTPSFCQQKLERQLTPEAVEGSIQRILYNKFNLRKYNDAQNNCTERPVQLSHSGLQIQARQSKPNFHDHLAIRREATPTGHQTDRRAGTPSRTATPGGGTSTPSAVGRVFEGRTETPLGDRVKTGQEREKMGWPYDELELRIQQMDKLREIQDGGSLTYRVGPRDENFSAKAAGQDRTADGQRVSRSRSRKDISRGNVASPASQAEVPPSRDGMSDKKCAFLAEMEKSVKQNAPIRYRKAVFDIGSDLSAATGVFTAPHSGTYVFSYQIFPAFMGEFLTDLYKNGSVVSRMRCQNQKLGPTESSAVTDQARGGDRYWLQVSKGGELNAGPHSYFSGTLVAADEA